jgi:excinuclease ABC subunit A
MLTSLAAFYKIDLTLPFNDLPDEHKQVILNGSGTQDIEFKYMNDRGDVVTRTHPFEGILPNMERRYKDTESNSVRDELTKYISTQHCPSCDGSRLREEARNVFINGTNITTIADLSIGDAHDFFDKMDLSGQKAQIAEKILKEIKERLGFLVNVGLTYLSVSRSADTLSGGEAQRI